MRPRNPMQRGEILNRTGSIQGVDLTALECRLQTCGNSGPAPDACSEKIFTAGQIAGFLGLSGWAVRKRLQHEPAKKLPTPGGQTANGWVWGVLPAEWQNALAAIAKRKGYRCAEDMLSDKSAAPWAPPVPPADVPERFQAEAIEWRNALMPILPRQHDTDPGELCQRGLEHCRKVFGRAVSESTWRRHFDLAVQRDNGLQQWGRVEIYVAEEAFQRSGSARSARAMIETGDLPELTDAFSQVANPSSLTVEDRDFIWAALIKSQAPREAVLDYRSVE